jgi:CRP/FNR family transcriptional regulator
MQVSVRPEQAGPMSCARSNEVDCGGCVSSRRCWGNEATPGAGFFVRRVRPLEAGEILFRQGARFEAPYLVTSGCIAVTELLPHGAERIVAFRVAGDLIGLESWNGPAHRFGALAVCAATLCRLRWSTTGGLVRNAALLRALLTKATAQSPDFRMPWAGLPAADRVRAFAEDFRHRTGQPLPMTRAQIGQYLGLAEETVVRAFKSLGRRT